MARHLFRAALAHAHAVPEPAGFDQKCGANIGNGDQFVLRDVDAQPHRAFRLCENRHRDGHGLLHPSIRRKSGRCRRRGRFIRMGRRRGRELRGWRLAERVVSDGYFDGKAELGHQPRVAVIFGRDGFYRLNFVKAHQLAVHFNA